MDGSCGRCTVPSNQPVPSAVHDGEEVADHGLHEDVLHGPPHLCHCQEQAAPAVAEGVRTFLWLVSLIINI